jgi:tRNA pseudouridine55 synthase
MQKMRVDGVLLFDKPLRLSSNAALQHVRRLFGAARAGHTGTLDPLATGLMALCLGEATKFSGVMLDADKGYRARVRLGIRTATADAEGEVLERLPVQVDSGRLEATLQLFRGEIEQIPPMHSAIKHQGRPLYAYARKGEQIERKARRVVIRALQLLSWQDDELEIDVRCTKGTYIRTLAEDIGAALGCGAHLSALRRTGIGPFDLSAAISLDALTALDGPGRLAQLLPPDSLLQGWGRFTLPAGVEAGFLHGQAVPASGGAGEVAVYASDGRFLGLGEFDAEHLRPKRLLATPS